jgi:hypothetical protein
MTQSRATYHSSLPTVLHRLHPLPVQFRQAEACVDSYAAQTAPVHGLNPKNYIQVGYDA